MALDHPAAVLLALALTAGLGLLLSRLAERARVPDVVLFLLAGLALGGLGWRPFLTTGELGQAITLVAAAYILYQGGRSLELAVLRPVWLTVALLATLGVVVSMLAVGLVSAGLFGLPLLTALLLGAVLAPTDPAVLIPIYSTVKVRARLSQVVISEAALNDATGAICAGALTAMALGAAASPLGSGLDFVRLAGVGLGIGAGFGLLNVALIAEPAALLRRHAGVLSLPVVVLAYVLAERAGGSGLMAAFAAGIVAGNHAHIRMDVSELARRLSGEYGEATAVVVRALLFVGLGANIEIGRLAQQAGPALLVVLALVLVARPLTVLAGAVPDRRAAWSWRELLLLGWTRETGVVPGALAALLVSRGVPGAALIVVVVAMAILVTVLVQGSTTDLVVRRLDLPAD